MKKEQLEQLLENMLSTGGDFAEVFLEDTKKTIYNLVDSKLEKYQVNNNHGVGLRLAYKDNVYYGATNDYNIRNIRNIINDLKSNIKSRVICNFVELDRLKKYKHHKECKYEPIDIKNKLKEIDTLIRSKDKRINQVNIALKSEEQTVTIANLTGLYVQEERIRTRMYITINLKDGEKTASVSYSYGKSNSFDIIDEIDYEKKLNEIIKEGIDKLYAEECIGRKMPVVIESGFGGVIFHEACGHALEATSVADNLSVLSNLLGKKVAGDKVTIVDDGTMKDEWGSSQIDDEGCPTRKNILIENGVLKSYLVDEINSHKMNHQVTGSGRRENYLYASTSRMNNTYLLPGNDKVEDMIKSIDLGLYAKKLGGGQVSTETGDFNFGCDVAYMIRDGKICECVKSASLIGNTKEILENIEMVGNNLDLGPGMCGSISGSVPVNVGMPTIKVSSILVGGSKK